MLARAKDFIKKLVITSTITFLLGYLGYHLFTGQNGVGTYFHQKSKLEKLEKELSTVEAQRNALKNKVERLYPQSLDADLLDEQYRRATGNIKKDEIIYYYDKEKTKK